MKNTKNKDVKEYILTENVVEHICDDQFDQSCISIAYIEVGHKTKLGVTTKTESKEAADFADSILGFVTDGLNEDNKVVDLFDSIESNLDVCIEDLSAAHLTSLIWCILSTIHFPDMDISADDAAKVLEKRILKAIRQALIEIYEGDVDA
jgi:hypothetical protein